MGHLWAEVITKPLRGSELKITVSQKPLVPMKISWNSFIAELSGLSYYSLHDKTSSI